jgi:hypothetical protein
MAARTIPDGAAVTNHFIASFSPFVEEGEFTSVSGLSDETEVIDGPDGRGYTTGKATRQTLTVVAPSHTDLAQSMSAWREKVENGAPGAAVTGTITVSDAGDTPIAIYELERCMVFSLAPNDLALDGAEVGQETFQISYARMRRIGP